MVRIFIVDDDALIRGKFREILEKRSGWVVVGESHNGRHAVDTFHLHTPHITLMDFQMPEMNGLEAARHLTGRHPDVLILLVTLYLSRQLVEEAKKVGIKGVCPKAQIHCVIDAMETLLRGETYFRPEQISAA